MKFKLTRKSLSRHQREDPNGMSLLAEKTYPKVLIDGMFASVGITHRKVPEKPTKLKQLDIDATVELISKTRDIWSQFPDIGTF